MELGGFHQPIAWVVVGSLVKVTAVVAGQSEHVIIIGARQLSEGREIVKSDTVKVGLVRLQPL